MSIEGIAALVSGADVAPAALASPGAPTKLYETVAQSLEQLNTAMVNGQGSLRELAAGDMDNLHQVIIGMERTRIEFDLLMSVRNRLLEAYQEIMRMQI